MTHSNTESCGDPHHDGHGNCNDVIADVWSFLDDELDPERRAAVQRHLDECSPCLEEAGIDRKLKELLARKCGGEHAPEALRQRIATQMVSWKSSVDRDGRVVTSVTAVTSATSVTSATEQRERG